MRVTVSSEGNISLCSCFPSVVTVRRKFYRDFWSPPFENREGWGSRSLVTWRVGQPAYIHRNPVKSGLCDRPEDWDWSSFRHYASGAEGHVEIESTSSGKIVRSH